jgi:hypothetical protein
MGQKLRDLEQAIKEPGKHKLWDQVTWREINITAPVKDNHEMFNHVARNCYDVLDKQKSYPAFCRSFVRLDLPAFDQSQTVKSYDVYSSVMDAFESDNAVTVDAVVHAMLEQVAGSSKDSDALDAPGKDGDRQGFMAQLGNYFSGAMSKLRTTDAPSADVRCVYINSPLM